MSYQIKWFGRGVEIEFDGQVEIEEIDEAGMQLYDDARFPECVYQVFDLSRAELSAISLEQIRNTAHVDQLASFKFPSPDLAIVSNKASSEALLFHYKYAAESLGIKWDIQTFRSLEAARVWCKTKLD